MLGFALLLFAVAIPQIQALLIEPESVRAFVDISFRR